jgi:CubicO group peptidase (beta-lactamase class C family)
MSDVNADGLQVMSGFPPPLEQRVRLDQVYTEPRLTHWFMQHARELCGTVDVSSRHVPVVALPERRMELDAVKVGRAGGGGWTVAEMLRGTCADGIAVLRRGHLVYERYFHGMRPDTPHLCQSVTKALASCAAARLVEDGAFGVHDTVGAIVPELAGSAYGDATVRDLLDMSVGIRYEDELDRPEYEGARLCRLEGVQPSLSDDEPGSAYDEATRTQKHGEHGGLFHYVSLNTIVLGWVMERATGAPAADLLRAHLWSKLGTEHEAYVLLDAAGSAQLEGGFACSLRDLARFGVMLCQNGRFGGQEVVPASWLDDVRRNGDRAAFAAAAALWDDPRPSDGCSYRSCFWVCDRGGRVSFSAAGWLGQRVYVDQEAGVVIALFSSRPQEREAELGAHAFQACIDLALALA